MRENHATGSSLLGRKGIKVFNRFLELIEISESFILLAGKSWIKVYDLACVKIDKFSNSKSIYSFL
jgi:hypothetical protein